MRGRGPCAGRSLLGWGWWATLATTTGKLCRVAFAAEFTAVPYRAVLCRLAAGAGHSVALSSSGQVVTWGQGNFGALGTGSEDNCESPAVVERLWAMGIAQV